MPRINTNSSVLDIWKVVLNNKAIKSKNGKLYVDRAEFVKRKNEQIKQRKELVKTGH